ncbi:MAG: hypothetical protein HF312_20220 [Ignavibacteria bacterium]|jgi:hypothetical protein|nr:hypothetical protein [Ignavibacteria bacterium]MCU7522550.1 hypothetical protein [Ignavibacteria bacterium]
MKKILLIFILFSSVLINAQDFRNAKWGASLKDIKRTETAKLTREAKGLLIYSGIIEGKPASIQYIFSDSGLNRIVVRFISVQGQDYFRNIDDHMKMISHLTEKYGKPDHDLAPWLRQYAQSSDTGKKNIIMHRIGRGLQSDLSWNSEKSKIQLSLSLSERKAPLHKIIYSSL